MLFGFLDLKTTPQDALIEVDEGKQVNSPLQKYLFVGPHKVNVSKVGYISNEQEINIKPGKNSINIILETPREKFIKTLPIYEDRWNIYYTENGDFISVVINQAPYEESIEKAKEYLKENGIDPKKENIYWSGVVGVQPGKLGI